MTQDMEKRLAALEDLEAIKKLQREYMHYWDNQELSKIPPLFADDGELQLRNDEYCKGIKKITEFYDHGLPRNLTAAVDGHLTGEPLINIDGDKAVGNWTVYILLSEPSVQWVQGKNDCEYKKVNGVWKFSKLSFHRTKASLPSLYLINGKPV